MAELVRVAALTGYRETMAGFGVDPRPFLREQGLTADLLANPERLIPAVAVIRLLERSAEATGCATFGLRMAEGRSLANLGATSLLIAHQPTLRQALATLSEFRSRINSTLVLHIEEIDGDIVLREDFQLSRPEPRHGGSACWRGFAGRSSAKPGRRATSASRGSRPRRRNCRSSPGCSGVVRCSTANSTGW